MSVRKQRRATDLTKERCYRTAFLLLFITYPATCGHIFTMLPQACQEICSEDKGKDCEAFLKADLTVKCHDDKYNRFVGFSYLLVVYPAAFPLVTLLILWKCLCQSRKRNSGKELDPLARGLRFFYENYSDNCWFWEIVELPRKVLLTSPFTDGCSESYIHWLCGITVGSGRLLNCPARYYSPHLLLTDAQSRTYIGSAAIISGLCSLLSTNQ